MPAAWAKVATLQPRLEPGPRGLTLASLGAHIWGAQSVGV